MDSFLTKQETYLEVGIHIGTKLKVIDMNPFIYRMRNDGLYVLDLRKIDERIRLAGKMLAQYEPSEVMVVASRTYSGNAAAVFSAMTGIKVYSGRFIPGILTNVSRKDFVEPKLLLVCDPKGERQAVIEAGNMGIPTIGLCDSDNTTTFIDWVVPCNNKGRRSLALIFYLFTREYLMGRGKIASYDEFAKPLSAFEAEQEEAPAAEPAEAPAQPQEAVLAQESGAAAAPESNETAAGAGTEAEGKAEGAEARHGKAKGKGHEDKGE
jgi:small subunit ribosomal protein S2